MATFLETSTGIWQITLTNREKSILEQVRGTNQGRFKALVEDFFTEQENILKRDYIKPVIPAYFNTSSTVRDQIDSLLGITR